MSVAAWANSLTPTAEEASITMEQLMSRSSWDVPTESSELPSFIGSSEVDSSWVRTDRPEEKQPAPPAPERPARPANQAQDKTWMGSDRAISVLTPEQQAVFEDVKIQLKDSGINVPEALIATFVITKKVSSAVVTSVKGYKQWANLLDYDTLPWERIEVEIKRGLFRLPHHPFTEGPNKSTTLFINSQNYEPRTGSRNICATLWLYVHYVLAKSDDAVVNGLSVVNLASGITYNKFYPAIQRAIFDSLQSVLPLRVAGMFMVDPPYIFKILWGVVSAWLSEKMKERMFILSSSNIGKHFNKSQVPTFLKGDLDFSPDEQEAFLKDMKEFYLTEFRPQISQIADAPGTGKKPELWEPASSK